MGRGLRNLDCKFMTRGFENVTAPPCDFLIYTCVETQDTVSCESLPTEVGLNQSVSLRVESNSRGLGSVSLFRYGCLLRVLCFHTYPTLVSLY